MGTKKDIDLGQKMRDELFDGNIYANFSALRKAIVGIAKELEIYENEEFTLGCFIFH